MRATRGKALYLDLELTCGISHPEKSQIIQIGVAEGDLMSLKITRSQSYWVRPSDPFTITDFCTQLTGITYDDVIKGNPIHEVLRRIQKHWSTKNKMCLTWGDDKEAIDQVGNPFASMTNLGWFHQLAYPHDSPYSLTNALALYGLKPDGRPHSAETDARSVARVHFEMLRITRGKIDTNQGND